MSSSDISFIFSFRNQSSLLAFTVPRKWHAGSGVSIVGTHVDSPNLRVHLFSLHPGITAEGVTIGNPPWTPAGVTGQIDAVTMVFSLPRWGRPGRIDSLRMQGAKLTLYRHRFAESV